MLRVAGGGRVSASFVKGLRLVRRFKVSKANNKATGAPLGIAYEKLTIGIPKETFPLEKRVAATPESVARLVKPGFTVQVETGAGAQAFFSDESYQQAGAKIVDDAWKDSDIILKVCSMCAAVYRSCDHQKRSLNR